MMFISLLQYSKNVTISHRTQHYIGEREGETKERAVTEQKERSLYIIMKRYSRARWICSLSFHRSGTGPFMKDKWICRIYWHSPWAESRIKYKRFKRCRVFAEIFFRKFCLIFSLAQTFMQWISSNYIKENKGKTIKLSIKFWKLYFIQQNVIPSLVSFIKNHIIIINKCIIIILHRCIIMINKCILVINKCIIIKCILMIKKCIIIVINSYILR